MQALSPLTMIGLSISFGCFDMALNNFSSSSKLNARFNSLNSGSPFRIKSFGRS